MTSQHFAGIIALAGAVIVFAVVIFFIAMSSKKENNFSVANRLIKIRHYSFWGTIAVLMIVLIIWLRHVSFPATKQLADEVVTVVGIQWDWRLTAGINDKKQGEFLGKSEISLPVNKRIAFLVTSGDVTHNFGIYSKTGELLTQVQAVPGYTNELQYVFTQKGNYKILCLEYCGLAHAFMTATIHVY